MSPLTMPAVLVDARRLRDHLSLLVEAAEAADNPNGPDVSALAYWSGGDTHVYVRMGDALARAVNARWAQMVAADPDLRSV